MTKEEAGTLVRSFLAGGLLVLLTVLALFAAAVLSSCGGDAPADAPPQEAPEEVSAAAERPFETIPLGLPCDPEDLPEAIPGCLVHAGDDFGAFCRAVPEQLACTCSDPQNTGDHRWFLASCRQGTEWQH